MRILATFALLGALQTCVVTPPEDLPPDEAPPTACGAVDYQWLVGENLAAVTLPSDLNARIITPGTVITMDYNPRRMNIVVDERGYIIRVYCG